MSHPILNDAQARMKKAVDHTLHEFSSIHTGKATPTMVETVTVEAYGSVMRLKECAAISTPDARMIQIQPWDVGLTKAIAKGIIDANLGFNPIVDGKTIRVPLPDMSRERRQEFVKTAQTTDPTACNYWRYCSSDGYLCQCCGGTCQSPTSVKPTRIFGPSCPMATRPKLIMNPNTPAKVPRSF